MNKIIIVLLTAPLLRCQSEHKEYLTAMLLSSTLLSKKCALSLQARGSFQVLEFCC